MDWFPTLCLVLVLAVAGCTSVPPDSPTPAPTTTTAETPNTTPATERQAARAATVTHVVDGDTLHVRFENGTTDTVRLLGVDTPEVHDSVDPAEFEGIPTSDAGRAWLGNWGSRASSFVKAELSEGERVRVATDPVADRRGGYDRLLAYVYYDDGALLNHQLLAGGYARVYDSEFSKRAAFDRAEATARETQVGLWGYNGSGHEPTTAVDRGAEPLAIVEIHADARGTPERDHLDDEYITFKNVGDTPLDLSEWVITDEGAHHSYTFGPVTLAPDEVVTLYTGAGDNTERKRYWGKDRPVWNNDGDIVVVRTDSNEVVVRRAYDGA